MTDAAVERAAEAGDQRAPAPLPLLRLAVLALRHPGAGRAPAARLHVGHLDGAHRCTSPAGIADTAHRSDVLAAMLDHLDGLDDGEGKGSGPALVWWTRAGALGLEDHDHGWAAAVRTTAAETGRDLGSVLLTRDGWLSPSTGTGRVWRRLRTKGSAPPPRPGVVVDATAHPGEPWRHSQVCTGSFVCMRRR